MARFDKSDRRTHLLKTAHFNSALCGLACGAGFPSRIVGIRLLDKGPPGQRCTRWQRVDRTAPLRGAPRTRRRPSTGKRSRPPQWMPFETSRALPRGLEVPDTELAYQPFAVAEAGHAPRERLRVTVHGLQRHSPPRRQERQGRRDNCLVGSARVVRLRSSLTVLL